MAYSRRAVFLLVGSAAWAAACSADSIESVDGLHEVPGEQDYYGDLLELTYEEAVEQHYREMSDQLAPEERVAIEEALTEAEIDLDSVVFVGRTIWQGDTFRSADSLLASLAARDKGRTLTVTSNSDLGLGPSAPSIYARCPPPTVEPDCTDALPYQFWRPYLNNPTSDTKFIVPNNFPFLLTLVTNAVSAIAGAASDCLTTGALRNLNVVTQSQWDAIGVGQGEMPRVFIIYGSQACSDPNMYGCATAPSVGPIKVNGIGTNRMMVGRKIGYNSADINANTASLPATQAMVIHEILHTLGLAHPSTPDSGSVRVPGTDPSSTVTSIMRATKCTPGPGCTWSHTLTTDDVDVIDTLYSAQAGSNCNYQTTFQTIAPN